MKNECRADGKLKQNIMPEISRLAGPQAKAIRGILDVTQQEEEQSPIAVFAEVLVFLGEASISRCGRTYGSTVA